MATKEKKSGFRVPLRFQIAGLLAFFVAVLGLISIYSTIDYLEQNKTSQVREIQNLQVTRQVSDLNRRWESAKSVLTEQAFFLLDPSRGSVSLTEDWKWIRVGDKIFQNPTSNENVATFPGAPTKREFLVTLSESQKTFYIFLPLDIKQRGVDKQEWAMAEVSRSVILGKETGIRSAIQEVLVNMSEYKRGLSVSELNRATWMGAKESVQAFGKLVSIIPAEDRKALLDFTPQPVSREIILQGKAGFIVSWASLPLKNSDLQLTLVTFVDRESLLKSFRSFVVKQSFFAFLILGAGFIFALVISRRLSKPVEEIAHAAKVMETGDFTVRVKIKRADEIGDLAGAFNHMGQALQEREEALQQAQNAIIQNEKLAAIGTLSAGIAHEVKNPLAGILGNADLVSNQIRKLNIPNAGPLLNYIEVIQKETKRCRGIIDSLMRFSRQEKATYAPMDLEVVLWETVQLVEHSLNLNKVTVVKDFAADLWMIDGNANQIEQTLLNMVQNAGHAMPEGGTITLATRYFADPSAAPKGKFIALQSDQFKGPFSRISIADTGIGMTEEVLKKIFEPFFTTKPKGVGTGLGLAVTLGILADHKARISIDSTPGKGTTFYMDFMAKCERNSNIVHELEEIKKKASGGAVVSTDVTAQPKKEASVMEFKKSEGTLSGLKSFPVSDTNSDKSKSKSLRPSLPPPPKKKEASGISELLVQPEPSTALPESSLSAVSSELPDKGWALEEDSGTLTSSNVQQSLMTGSKDMNVMAPAKKFQIKKPQGKSGASK